ncbi:MAG: hypothetical protein HOQ05_01910 [Corynebacteriales bacterium]|nr:hypothetical protein [Mycobacteriales bacterium]
MWVAGRHEEAAELYAKKIGGILRELMKLPVANAPQVPFVSCGDDQHPGDTEAYARFYIHSSRHQVLRPHLKEYQKVWAAAGITEDPYVNVDVTQLVPERFYFTTNDIKASNVQGEYLIDTEDSGVAPLSMILGQIVHYSAGDPWAARGNELLFSFLDKEGVIDQHAWDVVRQNQKIMSQIKVIESGINDVIRACRRVTPFMRLSDPGALVRTINQCHQAGRTEVEVDANAFLKALASARQLERGKIDPASVVSIIPSDERTQMLRTLRPPGGDTRAMGPQHIAGNRLARLLQRERESDSSDEASTWAREHSHLVLVSRNFGTAIIHSASQLTAFSGVTIVAAPGDTTKEQLAAGCAIVDTIADEAGDDELILIVATNQLQSFLIHLENNVFQTLFTNSGARVPSSLLVDATTSATSRYMMEDFLEFRPGINPPVGVYHLLYDVPDLIDHQKAKRFKNLRPELFITGDLSPKGFAKSWRDAIVQADRKAYLKNISEFYVLEAERRASQHISAVKAKTLERDMLRASDRTGPFGLVIDITQFAGSFLGTSKTTPPYVLSYRPPIPSLGPVLAELAYAPTTMPEGGDVLAIASPDLVHSSSSVETYWMENSDKSLWWSLISGRDAFDERVPRFQDNRSVVLLCSPGPLAESRRDEMFNEVQMHLKFLGKTMLPPQKLEVAGEKLILPPEHAKSVDMRSPRMAPSHSTRPTLRR